MGPTSRQQRRRRAALLFCTWLAGTCGFRPPHAYAVGEQSGRLRGRYLEASSQAPLPGAAVEVAGDALIGGARKTTTDEDGRFDLPNLPPGRYLVTVRYEGLLPVQRRVTIALGQTQDLDLAFAPQAAQTETLTIVEERRRLDADRTGTGVVLTAEQQSKLATDRSYQSIVKQAAGVVGGANPIMAGGSSRHNRYLVDGLDVTDPVTSFYSADFNFDAIAQVDAQVVPMDAQYNALGGVINLLTKTGADKLSVDSSFYFSHQALSVGTRTGTQIYEGALLQQNEPAPPYARYQANLNVGGPLIKQKLWYYLSTEYRYALSSVVPGPPLNQQHPSSESHTLLPRLKLTWAPGKRHLINLSVSADPGWFQNQRQSNVYTPEAEYLRQTRGGLGSLNYDWFITDKLVLAVQTGLSFVRLITAPQNGDLVSSAHQDRDSGIIWNAANAYRNQDDQRWRFQFDPTLKWYAKGRGLIGSHSFKLGLQSQYLRNYWLYGTPGDRVYFDRDGAGPLQRDPTSSERPLPCREDQPYPIPGSTATPCYRVRNYEPTLAKVISGWALGGFVQDVWKPTSRLTLSPGLRLDYGIFRNSKDEVVQNLLGIGPRLGITFDLTGDGRTLIRLSYGRANEVSSLLQSGKADRDTRELDLSYNQATRRFDRFYGSAGGDGGYDLRARCAGESPATPPTLACGNARLNLNPPHADAVIAALERELVAGLVGSLTYTFRHMGNQWQRVDVNSIRRLDGGDYAAYGDPRYGSIYAYLPSPALFRQYHGLDFALAGSPISNLNLYVAYTLSFLYGNTDNVSGSGEPGDDLPRDFRLTGYLADDHRHQVKAQVSYALRGLAFGVNLTYLSGAPLTRLYDQPIEYASRAWRGVDPGADPNDIRKWSELRSPDYLDVSLRVQYDLGRLFSQKQHLNIIADIFNVFNLTVPIDPDSLQSGVDGRSGVTYGVVNSRQSPLRAQLAVRYQY
jgi:hypothetical protein